MTSSDPIRRQNGGNIWTATNGPLLLPGANRRAGKDSRRRNGYREDDLDRRSRTPSGGSGWPGGGIDRPHAVPDQLCRTQSGARESSDGYPDRRSHGEGPRNHRGRDSPKAEAAPVSAGLSSHG